jgi:tetratricopeptide (TPR) repeat protein
VYEVTVGEEHTDAATTLNNLGSLRARQGKFDVARRALARALAIRRAAYGDDHPSTAAVLNNQALLHERLGEFEPAHDLYRRAHAALEKHHGPDHPSLHSALSGLGVTSSALGRYEDAVGFFARAADLPAGNVLEEDVAVNEMAHARALWDAPVGAGRDRERALAMMRRALSRLDGPVHGTTIAPIRAAARAWLDVRAAEARIIGGPRRPFQR